MFRRPCGVRRHAVTLVIALATALTASEAGRAQDSVTGDALAIRLAPRHEHYRPRIAAAARESRRWFSEWLGPPPPGLTIDDGAAGDDPAGAGTRVTLDLPWLSAPATMDIESQVAFALARAWWPGWAADPAARPMVDGLAWYLQSRVTPELFSVAFQRPGHSAEASYYFGGTLPWAFPLLVRGPSSAGLGSAVPPGAESRTSQVARAFGTVERLLGWPAVEGALTALAPRASAGAMTPREIDQVLSSAVGYPLSWLMEPARAGGTFDYALGGVSTVPCDGRACWRTTVVVSNRGDIAFTGVNDLPLGGYEQGDAVQLLVRFDGGVEATARWDGRASSRTFEFESTTPPVEVQLDPDGLLLLDRNALDHSWRAQADASVPLTKWVAWWLLWMQDLAITHTALL